MTEAPNKSDISFRARDVDGLIKALSEVAPELTRGQWGLLLSIFAAAAGRVVVGDDEKTGTFSGIGVKDGGMIKDPKNKEVEILREQLLNAYTPAGTPGDGPLRDMVSPPRKK